MKTVKLADAKARLSELVSEVAIGEVIEITRRGKPVARLVAAEREPGPIDVDRLRRLTARMPVQHEGAGDLVRRMRDEGH